MDVDNQIIEAKKILKQNGYLVLKMSDDMIIDMNECEKNIDKDCDFCSWGTCILQE